MENSIRYDYLTEKIWDALLAGCVPIYMGTPDVYRWGGGPHLAACTGRTIRHFAFHILKYI